MNLCILNIPFKRNSSSFYCVTYTDLHSFPLYTKPVLFSVSENVAHLTQVSY